MPDWKNPEEYAFAADLDRNGWTWEFMRRNPEYRTGYASLPTAKSDYDPPRQDGESEQEWVRRVMHAGLEPRRMTPYELFARKWRVVPPICDPSGLEKPAFDLYPIRPSFVDQVQQYFEDDEPYGQITDFEVLVFDLQSDIGAQVENARAHLLTRQLASSTNKWRKIRATQWTTYLRLLDAEDAGATSKEIRAHLAQYLPESEDADHKHKAADKFSDHRNSALKIRKDPLSILKVPVER